MTNLKKKNRFIYNENKLQYEASSCILCQDMLITSGGCGQIFYSIKSTDTIIRKMHLEVSKAKLHIMQKKMDIELLLLLFLQYWSSACK